MWLQCVIGEDLTSVLLEDLTSVPLEDLTSVQLEDLTRAHHIQSATNECLNNS